MLHKYYTHTVVLLCVWLFSARVLAEDKLTHRKEVSLVSEKTEKEPRNFGEKNLRELTSELLEYNPELKGLVEKIQVYELRVPQAGSLDDLRFSFEGSNIPIRNPALNRTAMTGLQIYLRQKFPFPGKLKLKKQIASTQAEQEKQAYYERLNQLVARFKQTYFEYVYVNQAIRLNQRTKAKFKGLVKFLEARYSIGKGTQQDILKTKIEISNIEKTLIQLREAQKVLVSRLNTLLYRPENIPLKIKLEHQGLTSLSISIEALRQLAQENRPWIKKKTAQIQEAELGHRLAKKGLLPDFDFGAGYRIRQVSPGDPVNGEDFFSAGVTINLPVYAGKKQNKQIQEMLHRQKQEEYLKQATTQEVFYQAEKAYFDSLQFKSQFYLLKDNIIPQDNATINSSRASYEADKIDFLNVLLSEISLLNHQIDQVRYHSQYHQKLAEIEMAVGLPIHIINQAATIQEGSDAK
ncbi:MAG: TolC family protein [Deltaproteobacteria bacterium]|nr:TolC family protein [Deltaproteobacteria bacterium]